MQERAQWWLVITSPLSETMLPEQPPPRRTEERRTWSSHSLSGPNPYFCFTFPEGKLSKVHIPSSARAMPAHAARRPMAIRRFMMFSLLESRASLPSRPGSVKAAGVERPEAHRNVCPLLHSPARRSKKLPQSHIGS